MVLKATIVIIGPPGSGKGTQADLLAESIGAIHLSSGQVLRDHASEKVKSEMDRGELVHEKEVQSILENSLVVSPENATWILDGYLRLKRDKSWLEDTLEKLDRSINLVVIIDTPEEVCKSRVLARGRDDDTASAWTERWKEYESMTRPVIESLKSGAHILVNGDQDSRSINQEIIQTLPQFGIQTQSEDAR